LQRQPRFKRLRVLAQDNGAYRKQGQVWLRAITWALFARQHPVPRWRCSPRPAWHWPIRLKVAQNAYGALDALMAGISGLSRPPAWVFFVWDLPLDQGLQAGAPTVVLIGCRTRATWVPSAQRRSHGLRRLRSKASAAALVTQSVAGGM
jgi:hypothetical protein